MPPQPRTNTRGRRHTRPSTAGTRVDAREQGDPYPHPLAPDATAGGQHEHGDKQGSETEVHKHCTTARAERPGDQSPGDDQTGTTTAAQSNG